MILAVSEVFYWLVSTKLLFCNLCYPFLCNICIFNIRFILSLYFPGVNFCHVSLRGKAIFLRRSPIFDQAFVKTGKYQKKLPCSNSPATITYFSFVNNVGSKICFQVLSNRLSNSSACGCTIQILNCLRKHGTKQTVRFKRRDSETKVLQLYDELLSSRQDLPNACGAVEWLFC